MLFFAVALQFFEMEVLEILEVTDIKGALNDCHYFKESVYYCRRVFMRALLLVVKIL